MQNISNLLSKNNINKNEIKKIAVSRGPGSFTGVRVGIATTKGLQKALKCQCSGISILEAMVLKAEKTGEVLTGFSVGKNEVCRQIFEMDDLNIIREKDFSKITFIDDFVSYIENRQSCELILESDLFNKISAFVVDKNIKNLKVTELTENPSKYIGLRSEQFIAPEEILPIYAREERAL